MGPLKTDSLQPCHLKKEKHMNFIVLTIFPDLMDAFWSHGIVRRAIEADLISAVSMDIRAFSTGKHKEVDDRPYGGGNGMVMRPEPLAAAIRAAK